MFHWDNYNILNNIDSACSNSLVLDALTRHYKSFSHNLRFTRKFWPCFAIWIRANSSYLAQKLQEETASSNEEVFHVMCLLLFLHRKIFSSAYKNFCLLCDWGRILLLLLVLFRKMKGLFCNFPVRKFTFRYKNMLIYFCSVLLSKTITPLIKLLKR